MNENDEYASQVALRLIGILAGAVRRMRFEPRLAEEIAARVERAQVCLQDGSPGARAEVARHLAACEKLLGW